MNEPTIEHIDPNEPVDLTNCDREPIHLLGQVQSYGALIALSRDWTVEHASENLGEILGHDVDNIIGCPVSDLIDTETLDRIREGATRANIAETALRLFGVSLRDNGKLFDLSLHDNGSYFILEFEPKAGPRSSDVMSEVYPLIRRIDTTHDLATLAMNAADGLRAIAGFDSVMVYEFQPDHSGRVVAESRSDGETRYLGLNFPASDIPVQARALYKKALIRLIADVNDPGSVIRPGIDAAGAPVDLSLAVTRAVSPIHIEYLHNMGIEASMSVSIMKDGELWGLFACHHNSPRYIDYERRTAVELFAHLFAFELGQYQSMLRGRAQEDTTRLQTRIMAHMADGLALDQSLFSLSDDIAKVIPHDGMVLYHAGDFSATGVTPDAGEFEEIATLLDGGPGAGIFSTEELGAALPGAQVFADRTAGILAIPVSRYPRDYLVLCREPVTRKVSWAGDPTKPAEVGPNGTRLTPRKSFETWQQDVEGRSEAWSDHARHAAEQLRVVLLEIFLKVTDATAEERRRAQEQQELLISELNHRVRNILNLMQGLVSQTKSDARGIADFTNRLDGRIQSLARAHDQLTRDRWEPAPLKELIRCEFEAYAAAKTDRVIIDGPDALLSPTAYTNLALVVHEMATNSMKYGALCDQSGRVDITIRETDDASIVIDWKEAGGPPVQAPKRRGFGSTIIEMSIPHELGGEASIDYRVSGVEARFRVPAHHISRIEDADLTPATATTETVAPEGFHLSGTGLVVEDTLIIAMDAQGILEDFGASEVKISASVQEALDMIETQKFDFALLDVNLGDEQSGPVAHRLARDGVPFVVSTGYGEAPEVLKSYPPCPVVQKPFSDDSLRTAFAQAVAALSGGDGVATTAP
jgi:light-regulated signal transduction histidine kinase (bacteriophytochrome)/CheY-like chemotaxis protein